jgi:hypothetical protein
VVGGSRVHRGGPRHSRISRTPAALGPYVSASRLEMRAAAVPATQDQDARRSCTMARGRTRPQVVRTAPDDASELVPRKLDATRIVLPPGGLGRPAVVDPA